MMERRRKQSLIISLIINEEKNIQKLKRQFFKESHEFEFLPIPTEKDRLMYNYDYQIKTGENLKKFNDVLEFQIQSVSDTTYPEIFPLSNYNYATIHQRHYLITTQNNTKVFLPRRPPKSGQLLKASVDEEDQNIIFSSLHEYIVKNEINRHINITKYDKQTNKSKELNLLFKYGCLGKNEKIIKIITIWQEKELQFYIFTKSDQQSSIKIMYFFIQNIEPIQTQGENQLHYQLSEQEIKKKFFELKDNETLIKLICVEGKIYLITNHEIYFLEKNPRTSTVTSKSKGVLEKMQIYSKKPMLAKTDVGCEEIKDVFIMVQKILILTVNCCLYILTEQIVEERYNLSEKIYSEANNLNVEKIAMINQYLVVFFSEFVDQSNFQEKNQFSEQQVHKEKLSKSEEVKRKSCFAFRMLCNSLQYYQHIILPDFMATDNYQINIILGSFQLMLQYVCEKKLTKKLVYMILNIKSMKQIKNVDSILIYEPNKENNKIKKVFSSSVNGLMDIVMFFNKLKPQNQHETLMVIENYKEYRYNPIFSRKQIQLNCNNFRQPVITAIDPFALNIFLAMKETIILVREFDEKLTCIAQLYLPGIKFGEYEIDGRSLIIATSETVYILNPWEFKIVQSFKIMGKISSLKVGNGIILVSFSHNQGKFIQILTPTAEKPLNYTFQLEDIKNHTAITADAQFLVIVTHQQINIYEHQTRTLFNTIKTEYQAQYDEYPTAINISQELGFLLVGSSIGNIRQYLWPITEEKNKKIEENVQKICESAIIYLEFNRQTFSQIKIRIESGPIILYKVNQYLKGEKKIKPQIISKTLNKRFMLSKMNIFKNHWVIPTNHVLELEKILLELEMNYQTIVGTNEEEKRRNKIMHKNNYDDMKQKLKELIEEQKKDFHKQQIFSIRAFDEAKKDHQKQLDQIKKKVNEQSQKQTKEIKKQYEKFSQNHKKYEEEVKKYKKLADEEKKKLCEKQIEILVTNEGQILKRKAQIKQLEKNNEKKIEKHDFFQKQLGFQNEDYMKQLSNNSKNERQKLFHERQIILSNTHTLQNKILKLKEKKSDIDMIKMEMEMQINEIQKNKEKKMKNSFQTIEKLQKKADMKYLDYLLYLENKNTKKTCQNSYLKKALEEELEEKQTILKELKIFQKQLNQKTKQLNDEIIKERNGKINALIDIESKKAQIKVLKKKKNEVICKKVNGVMKVKNLLKFLITSIVNCLKEGKKIESMDEDDNREEIKQRNQYINDVKNFINLIKQRFYQKRVTVNINNRKQKLYSETKKINPINIENQNLLLQFNTLKQQYKELNSQVNLIQLKKKKSLPRRKERSKTLPYNELFCREKLQNKIRKKTICPGLIKIDKDNIESQSIKKKNSMVSDVSLKSIKIGKEEKIQDQLKVGKQRKLKL